MQTSYFVFEHQENANFTSIASRISILSAFFQISEISAWLTC